MFNRIWIGSIGKNGRISVAPAMLNIFPKFELEPISTYFETFCTVRRPMGHGVTHDREVVLPGNVRGAVNRYPDISSVQRWRVIDPVAEETNYAAETLQG